MALRVRNEETERLAQGVARETGESLTAAVTEAIRERWDRVSGDSREGMAEPILKIGKECAAHFKEPYKSIDHGELLHDEKGLPK